MDTLVAPSVVLVMHAASTWFMTGLVWYVQVTHYPLFGLVGTDNFRAYHRAYVTRTGFVIPPVMLLEAATAVALLSRMPSGFLEWLGVTLLAVIWISTFLLQVPLHNVLAQGVLAQGVLAQGLDHQQRCAAIVRTNWIRTAAWSLRGVVAAVMLLAHLEVCT